MKTVPTLSLLLAASFAGCASRSVSVRMPAAPHQPAHEISTVRGKSEDWRPPVSIENVQGFDEETFADLRKNFIEPLTASPYRYAIDAIQLVAVPEAVREWTLFLTLDNGGNIRVDDFVEWNEARQTYFHSGLKRTLAGLEQASRRDPALGRYVAQHGKKRKLSKAEIAVAQAEAHARNSERVVD